MLSEIANFSKNLLSLKHMIKRLKIWEDSAVRGRKWLDHALLLASLIIIWGALVYYIYKLNISGIIITLLLSGASFWKLKDLFAADGRKDDKDGEAPARYRGIIDYILSHKTTISLAAGFIVLLALAFHGLIEARSDRALISPWQVVSRDFLWFYAAAALLLIIILNRTKMATGRKIALVSAFYFLSFSVAAIVYKIGYGFDPFIHQATMELIAAKGAVLPKTPYYLGEYSLVIIISKLTGLAIQSISRYLVPLMAAIFLPAAIFHFLERHAKSKSAALTAVIFLLAIGFSPFIITTPQNLSYLFLLLAVLSVAGNNSFWRTLVLALASAAIHPMSGLPALSLAAYAALQNYDRDFGHKLEKTAEAAIWAFTAFAIPAALFISSGASAKNIGGAKLLAASIRNLFGTVSSAGREDLATNFAYLLADNYHLAIIIAIAGSLIYILRSKQVSEAMKAASRRAVIISSALLAAYLLSGQIIFDEVIDYERAGYANRIPVAIIIFMLPGIAVALEALIRLIKERPLAIRGVWAAFGLCLLSASLYTAYPRFDKYFNSHGYSTSANDIAAVQSIAAEAHSPYIALANQQVSAAALRAFGFDHYYQTAAGELYFYPIPTGSPLYQYYLDMVYKNPGRETMAEAMDLAGVDKGYLVVNKYWYQSGRIINEAKLEADRWWTINDDVYVFKYQR